MSAATSTTSPPQAREHASSSWWPLLLGSSLLIVLFLVAIAYTTKGLRLFQIPSRSMEPTIRAGDRIIADTDYYASRHPKDHDIVMFQKESTIFIKRVIASGGERVEGKAGVIYVDGKKLVEPYVQHIANAPFGLDNFGPVNVKPGEYFVMGDNRDISLDSRSPGYGAVTTESLVGKPVLVLFNPRSTRFWKSIR